jgi:ceramide glucosyltransferase
MMLTFLTIASVLLSFIAILFSILPIGFALRFVLYIRRGMTTPPSPYRPAVSIIVPCKGLDPGFRENLQALFEQEYEAYQIVFITATKSDEAYPVIEDLILKNPGISAKLVTAGIADGRSQKVNNQLEGITHSDSSAEVFLFIDSDAKPAPEFLQEIVKPLADPKVGLTTGFRWYLPKTDGFASILRSAWNGGGIVFLTNPYSNYAWGGAMAIRRSTFDRCEVASYWETALSDDMTISDAVRKRHLEIRFVPNCLVPIHEDCSFMEMIEWTNRQTVIAKVYHPQLWKSIALAHGMGNIILVVGAISLFLNICGYYHEKLLLYSSLVMLSIIPMEMLNGLFLLPAIKRMLPRHKARLNSLAWRYCLLAPLASILALFNSAYSLFTNRITWRGITYRLISPNETIVCTKD